MTVRYLLIMLLCRASGRGSLNCVPLPASAKVVITGDEAIRGGKVTPLKTTVDTAVKDCSSVEKVFVVTRTGADIPMYRRDVFLKEVLCHQ